MPVQGTVKTWLQDHHLQLEAYLLHLLSSKLKELNFSWPKKKKKKTILFKHADVTENLALSLWNQIWHLPQNYMSGHIFENYLPFLLRWETGKHSLLLLCFFNVFVEYSSGNKMVFLVSCKVYPKLRDTM